MQATPRDPRLLEFHPSLVVPQKIRSRIIGDKEIDQAVVVNVRGDNAQPSPGLIDDAGLGSYVDESAAIIAEEVVRQRREKSRRAVVKHLVGLDALGLGGHRFAATEFGMLGIPAR